MKDPILTTIRDLIQEDVGERGLRTDPVDNLVTACAGDFSDACRSLADCPQAAVGIVTGFLIPQAQPPSGETDGPLGSLFLARALTPLGMKVVLITDRFCLAALEAGLTACGLEKTVELVELPLAEQQAGLLAPSTWQALAEKIGPLTHLIAVERVGPSHTLESVRSQPRASAAVVEQFLQAVPAEHHDRCHTMRGIDITAQMSPAHLLLPACARHSPGLTTIGIGDGGNEIGMGKIPWDIVRRNVPRGGLVACRVPVDHVIVCGVSNWGAYGLAAGVRCLRGQAPEPELFEIERECELLRVMVEQGPLVDGMTGLPTVSVDGLAFERYAEPLLRLSEMG